MLDWLIIGGGIHGVSLAFHLIQRQRIAHDRIRILDPHDHLLARWESVTTNTGMDYLRSPEVYHLHNDPWSLRTFAQTRAGQPLADFIPIYHRPSLDLFNAFSASLIQRARLDTLLITGRAQALTRCEDGWRVQTSDGEITAHHVVLAIGAGEQPYWPEWARTLQESDAPINHVFDPAFVRAALPDWENAVIIGGGITAAQTALTMAAQQPGSVTLLMRHPIRISHFDSDPCWVTRICLADFERETDYDRRRTMIQQARQRGSMPSDVAEDLTQAVEAGLLRVAFAEVTQAEGVASAITLRLTSDEKLTMDRVILATGYESVRPGGAWLYQTIVNEHLPVAGCGYPIVDETLCWSPGLYVMGPLAELEIGPVSRNVIGARLAVERLKRAM
jgi:cation diffusion facilitator CzcD-associated flavoprotein CzcO